MARSRGYFGIGAEGVSKSANVGALLRTAHAFDAHFCFTLGTGWDARAARRADTADTASHVPLWRFPSAAELTLPEGCQLVGVELADDAADLPSFRHPLSAAYVLGPERSSLSPALLTRCLSRDRTLELNFLYQDLFFGAKEQGLAEHGMLQMMSTLNQALQEHGGAPGQLSAIVAPATQDDEIVLRVSLYAEAGGAPLASCDKPLDLVADLALEVDDVRDALATIGVRQVSVALKFDAQGLPLEVRPLD